MTLGRRLWSDLSLSGSNRTFFQKALIPLAYLLYFGVFTSGCQTCPCRATKTFPSASQLSPPASQGTNLNEETVRSTFPRNKQADSPRLAALLQKSGIKPVTNGNALTWTLRNVFCSIGGADRNTTCELESTFKKPSKVKLSPDGSRELLDLILRYPVRQGETGAYVSFLQCRSETTQNENSLSSCEIAIDMDYPGPF